MGTKKKKRVDWKKVESMLEAQCELGEIAPNVNLSLHQLKEEMAKKYGEDPITAAQRLRDRGKGKGRVRLYNWKDENEKLMTFWAKNHLGMADKLDQNINTSGGLTIFYDVPDNGTGTEDQAPTPPSR